MPKLGVWELVIILVIVLVIFGAGRLPEIGSAIGRSIRSFKRGLTGPDEDGDKAERKVKTQKEEKRS